MNPKLAQVYSFLPWCSHKRNANDELEGEEYNETKYVFYIVEPFFRNVLKNTNIKLKW
jgi:hypothetical protein